MSGGTPIGRLGNWRAHHQTAGGRGLGLVVFIIGAHIANMRESKGDDLRGIGRIGQDFLISRHGRIEADFAYGIALGAYANAFKDTAVGKDQKARGDTIRSRFGVGNKGLVGHETAPGEAK
jgi:hypothetical protein